MYPGRLRDVLDLRQSCFDRHPDCGCRCATVIGIGGSILRAAKTISELLSFTQGNGCWDQHRADAATAPTERPLRDPSNGGKAKDFSASERARAAAGTAAQVSLEVGDSAEHCAERLPGRRDGSSRAPTRAIPRSSKCRRRLRAQDRPGRSRRTGRDRRRGHHSRTERFRRLHRGRRSQTCHGLSSRNRGHRGGVAGGQSQRRCPTSAAAAC
jgi:hypothetical protein